MAKRPAGYLSAIRAVLSEDRSQAEASISSCSLVPPSEAKKIDLITVGQFMRPVHNSTDQAHKNAPIKADLHPKLPAVLTTFLPCLLPTGTIL